MFFNSRLDYIDECMGSLNNNLPLEQIHFLKEQMLVSFDKLETEIHLLKKHPDMPPHFIRMSRYALFLNKNNISKKYFDQFNELNISIDHFSQYIQQYYSLINNFFSSH